MKKEQKDLFTQRADEVARKYGAVTSKYAFPVMQIKRKVPFEKIKVFIISDVHLGSKELNLRLLKEYIKEIENTPNAVVIINGDLLDNALKSSVSDIYDAALQPTEQQMAAISLLWPIKDKIAAIVRGNHEYRTDKETGINPLLAVCLKLGIEDLYAGHYYNLILENINGDKLSIFGTHGSGLRGGSAGNVMNKIKKIGDDFPGFDWYVAGHVHVNADFEEEKSEYNQKTGKIEQKTVCYTSVPAWMNYGGYGAFYNYSTPNLKHKIYEWTFEKKKPYRNVYDFIPSYAKTKVKSETAYKKEVNSYKNNLINDKPTRRSK